MKGKKLLAVILSTVIIQLVTYSNIQAYTSSEKMIFVPAIGDFNKDIKEYFTDETSLEDLFIDYHDDEFNIEDEEDSNIENNIGQADKLVEIALGELGYREGKNNDTKYGDWYGMSNNEWCAMFISWCANEVGISTDIIPKHALCSDGADWFKDRGLWQGSSYIPKPGDIMYVNRDGSINHIGIVKSVSGSTVNTIEGNTSDMVAERSYKIGSSKIAGYGCPKYNN